MRNFSLRLPYLIYLCIGSILVGVIIAPAFREVPPTPTMSETMDHAAMHGTLEVPARGAPEVDLSVVKDAMEGWNVTLDTRNFTFTPKDVNTAHVANTGHAHVYVNGMKMARLYGPHAHIPDLPEGQHEITVNLSTNAHEYYTVDGTTIEDSVTIEQGPANSNGM